MSEYSVALLTILLCINAIVICFWLTALAVKHDDSVIRKAFIAVALCWSGAVNIAIATFAGVDLCAYYTYCAQLLSY